MMERPTQGLLDNYRTLRKTTKFKKKWKSSLGVFLIELVCGILFLLSFVVSLIEFYREQMEIAFVAEVVMLISVLGLLLILEYDRSRLFRQDEASLIEWNKKFHDFLQENYIEESDIDQLLEWCGMVVEMETPIKKLMSRIEKMFSVFMIPAIISFVYKLDTGIPKENAVLIKIVNVGITVILGMMGLLVCVAIPGISLPWKNDRTLLADLRTDLLEYKFFYGEMLSDACLSGKRMKMSYNYSCSESKRENGVQDKREKEELSIEKIEKSK